MAEDLPVITGKRRTILGNLLTAMFGASMLGALVYLSGYRISAEPIPEEIFGFAGAIGNAILFVILATVGATLVILLLKYGRERFLRYFLLGAFGFIAIVIFFYFGTTFLVVFWDINALFAAGILLAFIVSASVTFYLVDAENRLKNAGLLVFGSSIGAFLGVVLPLWTSLLLLIGLAIYDYVSVKRGPIRKIVELTEDDPDKIAGLSVTTAEWDIGLGDVAFYCMMTALAIQTPGYGGIIPVIFTGIGIIAGFLITLRLLESRGLIAGLPIPVSLGLLGLLLGFLLRFFFPFIP